MKKYFLHIFLVFGFLIANFVTPKAKAQCVVCRSAAESNAKEGDEGLAKGINSGILYLMFIPYALAGGAAYIVYQNYKKKKSEVEE